MTVPNFGPELPGPNAPDDAARGGNAALVYRDDAGTDEVEAASARASAVTQRFGGTRYALSRPEAETEPPPEGSGESDASQ